MQRLTEQLRTLWSSKLPLRSAWLAAFLAGVLNATGMSIDLVVSHPWFEVPKWPPLISAVVGLGSLIALLVARQQPSRTLIRVAYACNVVAVVSAFTLTTPYYAAHPEQWIPFQGNKLGCLVAALIAPSLSLGLAGILAHAGTAIWQFYHFTPEIQRQLVLGEPIATICFGLVGLLGLVFRFGRVELERRVAEARYEAMIAARQARLLLGVRDMINTPLQNIVLIAELLRSKADADLLIRLDQAVAQLTSINEVFQLVSSPDAETLAFDAEALIRETMKTRPPSS